MKYSPRHYQRHTTQQIIDLPECGPFLDMGLGKTVSALTGVVELKKQGQVRKVLIVAPKKVAETVWTDERDKWDHLQHLSISQVLGTEKQRRMALAAKADIYIINRENVVWLVALLGMSWDFDMLIIDELSSFKSPDSQRFKSLKLARKFVKRVVGLTGTPAPNGLLDLWAEIYLLDKGKRLGEKYTEYRKTYFDPGKKDGYTVFNYNLKKPEKEMVQFLGKDIYRAEIMDKISDICFSMKTEDYLDLPDRIDNDRFITMSGETMGKYLAFEEEQVLALLDEPEITAVNAAALTNKLLQFANGAVYDEDKNYHVVHNEMLEALDEILEALDGKPLLVFYQFKSDIERIKARFKYARLLKTPQDIKDWNAGICPLMLCHAMSAGHGLNLQFGGQNILWFGCPWSLEQYLQAIKRVHRSGVISFVTNTRLIMRGTMHEDVVKALAGKDINQNAVLAAVKARIEKYSKILKRAA